MPVFNVTVTAPNGNKRSRPMVAENADEALADWRQEIEIEEHGQVKGFTFEVEARDDPDGHYEQALKDAEQRALEAEFYRMPAPRRRVRR